jgi:hypothetical protein
VLFIASLITSIGAAYLYEKCEKTWAEIAIACAAIAVISLVLMLIVAPWQIKLLLVGVTLASYNFTKPNLFN